MLVPHSYMNSATSNFILFGAVSLVRQLGLNSFLEDEFTMKFNILI